MEVNKSQRRKWRLRKYSKWEFLFLSPNLWFLKTEMEEQTLFFIIQIKWMKIQFKECLTKLDNTRFLKEK